VVEALRRGESRVEYVYLDGVPRAIGLMGLVDGDGWMGAAGSASVLAEGLATSLAAVARADVTIVGADGAVVASTLDQDVALALVLTEASGVGRVETETVREVDVTGALMWVARGDLVGAGTVLFSRSVDEELAALPAVRRSAMLAGLLTLVLALGVGTLVASALTRPVRGLAEAAGRIAEGDFESPVPTSRVDEVDRLGEAFRSMRASLKGRLRELSEANVELEDKQQRLHELQAELIRQDRAASSGRIAAELAHEIRNPVANVRNCLEVVRRGLPPDGEGARFADMAIDELLRMHELAEHLLDLNRPTAPDVGVANAAEIAAQVAVLAGVGGDAVPVRVQADGNEPMAAIHPDALKQILFNLVDNAREAAGSEVPVEIHISSGEGRVILEVSDRGPGIDAALLPKVFDPFVSTKDAVTGVGLGLAVAQGLVRRHGGRIEAVNRTDGRGARFIVEVPAAPETLE
jgi:signal transduction histidine kinase